MILTNVELYKTFFCYIFREVFRTLTVSIYLGMVLLEHINPINLIKIRSY